MEADRTPFDEESPDVSRIEGVHTYSEHCANIIGKTTPIKGEKDELLNPDETTPPFENAGNEGVKTLKCYLCKPVILLRTRDNLQQHLMDLHRAQHGYHCDNCNTSVHEITAFNHHLSLHDRTKVQELLDHVEDTIEAGKEYTGGLEQQERSAGMVDSIENGDSLSAASNIKTEEIHIFSELPAEEDSVTEWQTLHSVDGNEKTKKRAVYVCKKCGMSFKHHITLKFHEFQVHNIQAHVCSICGKNFTYASRLRMHMKAIHKQGSDPIKRVHKCNICRSEHQSKAMLLAHLQTIHGSASKTYSCDQCSFTTALIWAYNRHLIQHGTRLRYNLTSSPSQGSSIVKLRYFHACYLCSTVKQLDSKASLQQHLDTVHPDEEMYYCNECDLNMSGKAVFNKHLLRHDETFRPFKCRVCPQRYSTPGNMKQHEAYEHGIQNGRRSKKQPSKVCPVCTKRVKIEALEQHILTEHPNASHVCSTCEEEFLTEKQLRSHENLMHGPIVKKTCEQTSRKMKKCHVCDTKFNNEQLLIEHLTAVHSSQSCFECKECHYYTKKIVVFNKHLVRHDPSMRPLKCRVCSLRFHKGKERQYHEITVHRYENMKREHVCSICGEEFANVDQLRLHRQKHKQTAQPEAAAIQPQKAENDQSHPESSPNNQNDTLPEKERPIVQNHGEHSEKHQNSNTGRLTSRCNLCNTDIELLHRNSLKLHIRVVHRKSSRFQCEKCNYSTKNENAINNHILRHDAANTKRFWCRFCESSYSLEESRNRHEIAKHPSLAINNEQMKQTAGGCYSCSNCNMTFRSLYGRMKHERLMPCQSTPEAVPVEEPLVCYLCAMATPFKRRISLEMHLQEDHPTKSTYQCEECNFSASSKFDYNKHLSQHIVDKRPYKCRICPLRFHLARNKRCHEVSLHNLRDREYSCSICGKKFAYESSLLVHKRTMHHGTDKNQPAAMPDGEFANKLPHKCNVCSRRFHTVNRRRVHEIAMHNRRDKDYSCSVCGETFVFESGLLVHKRKKRHGTEESQPQAMPDEELQDARDNQKM